MRRRPLSVLGAAAVLALAVPSGAHAASGGGCKQLVGAPVPATAGSATPFAVYQPAGQGDYTALWFTGLEPRAANALTSCTFHDRNRNGRFESKSEQVFVAEETLTVESEHGGKWPFSVVLEGLAKGEQVCSRTTQSAKPLSGGKAVSSTTSVTCFVVEPAYPSRGQSA